MAAGARILDREVARVDRVRPDVLDSRVDNMAALVVQENEEQVLLISSRRVEAMVVELRSCCDAVPCP